MGIDVDRVSRVVIAGEWYSVEVGSFQVIPFHFVVDGEPKGDVERVGFRFRTIDRDIYTGPVEALQIVKLTPE